jgi:hypothetical protein
MYKPANVFNNLARLEAKAEANDWFAQVDLIVI